MVRLLKARDIPSGQEGTAYITTEDGRNTELFYLRSVEANIEKTKVGIKTLGVRGTQHKTTGFEITGTMSIYSVTTDFLVYMERYKETGQDFYFNLRVTNQDATTSIGRKSVTLRDCNLDSATLAHLDVDEDFLSEDLDFTCEDFGLLERYNLPRVF